MSDHIVPQCFLFGCGGHAKMVIDALRLSGAARLTAALDSSPELWGTEFMGVPVIGGDDRLADLAGRGITTFVVGVGSVGDSSVRQRLYGAAIEKGFTPLTVRHPTSIVSEDATLLPGCQIFPGAIVNSGSVIGRNAIINTGAIVEHGCEISDHAHVAPGAVLGGDVTVGIGAHVGIGATVREGISIGARALVGAGSVVVADVATRKTVKGNPARTSS